MRKDLTGQVFGKITVVSFHHQKMPCYSLFWTCQCECGNEKIINGHALKTGAQKSCGCERDKTMFQKTHGLIKTYEYMCWQGMKARCKNNDWKHGTYIEKGITVCSEWANSFETFLADMGRSPSSKHTVDRIDNSKGYYPSNCRWATQRQQNRNYDQNKVIEFNGKKLCQAEWTEILGYKENTIHNRIKSGWSIEKALTTPVRPRAENIKRPTLS